MRAHQIRFVCTGRGTHRSWKFGVEGRFEHIGQRVVELPDGSTVEKEDATERLWESVDGTNFLEQIDNYRAAKEEVDKSERLRDALVCPRCRRTYVFAGTQLAEYRQRAWGLGVPLVDLSYL